MSSERRGHHDAGITADVEPGAIGRGSKNGTIRSFQQSLKAYFTKKQMPNRNWRNRRRREPQLPPITAKEAARN